MKVIVIASRKGGSGKTTLAGHLAVQAERIGDGPVAVVDVDPQGSLADWWNKRVAPTPIFMQTTQADLAGNIGRLRDMGTKILVIDTPPALTSTVGDIIKLADLVVIPTRPSPHDLRSIGATAELVEHLGKPLVFVLNGATPRARITNEAVTILSQHGLLAPVIVHQRVDFASSMIDGRTVMELPGESRSAAEIGKLWKYLASRVDGNLQLSVLPAIPSPSAADKIFAVAGGRGQNLR
ncbi:MAG: nucleotide-binding protein [Alphaproteobacteria bacterium]